MKVKALKTNFLLIAGGSLLLVSCASVHPSSSQGQLPPGQAKKIYGDQSARDYAPGQQNQKKQKPDGGSSKLEFK